MNVTKGRIMGNYRMLSELGKGLLGDAYLCEETIMGFKAVLRETGIRIDPDDPDLPDLVERLKSLSAVKHPHICGSKTAIVQEGRLILIGDYNPDRTLQSVLDEEGALAEERAIKISRQITDALMYAHREGIFHGRLSTGKIHLGNADSVTIRDFGIAGILGLRMYPAELNGYDLSGQVQKKRMTGMELDIYENGLLLYQMLTGKTPFLPDNEFYLRLLNDRLPPEFTIPAEDALSAKAVELISIMSTVTQPPCKLMTAKEIMLRRQERDESEESAQPAGRKVDLSPIELIRVEGGIFEMGDHYDDGGKDERPKHLVKLYPFYIAKHQLTQRQWVEVMGYNPSYRKGDDLPVESVSWLEAVAYCDKRSIMEGLVPCFSLDGNPKPRDWSRGTVYCRFTANGYRLPTEAEWEYAARGGKMTSGYRYAGSSNVMEVAWCRDNANRKPQPVGQKKPNELGLYDMSGNVWEWCWDWYDAKFYSPPLVLNPTGPDQGVNKVLRGGSFAYQPSFMRVSCRHSFGATIRYDGNGVRLVRSYLQAQPSK